MKFNEHRKILEEIRRFDALIPPVVTEMGALAQNHYVESFRNQGFTDSGLVRWKPRKRSWYRTRSGKRVNDTTRGILIGKGTGNLRKLRRRKVGKYSVDILSNPVTDDYARVHNEGLRSGRGSGFIMPKRQFVGRSRALDSKVIRMIQRRINTRLSSAA